LHQINLVRSGDFSEKELENTKKYLSQRLISVNDKADSIGSWYISQFPDGIFESPIEQLKKVENVTSEEISSCAKKIQLDTVFLLKRKKD
jgi:predicted Zn-dependent peptidase